MQTGSQTDRKSTQRERLIASMIKAVWRQGYEGATVSEVIAGAGVSRPTFYDYFADKEDCFLSAHRELGKLLTGEIARTIAHEPPERAVQATIRRLVELAEQYPERAALLVNEAMAGGLRAIEAHDALIERMTVLVEKAHARVAADIESPDLPVPTVLGAGRWLLAPALRRGERDLRSLADELIDWVESYNRPSREHRWRALEPGTDPTPSPYAASLQLSSTTPASRRGSQRPSRNEIARNQRERIMYATVSVVVANGYKDTTVADITAAGGVSRRVFYKHFRDRQHAFLAVHELMMQHTMTLAAGAFFSAEEWPERVWAAMLATTQFEAAHPLVTHFGHVQSHAVGPQAIQRIDDAFAAFTIFLQEGARYTARPPTRTAMEAVAGAIFEIGYHQARIGHIENIARLAPHAAYLALAPFLGPAQASEFIDRKLRARDARRSPPG